MKNWENFWNQKHSFFDFTYTKKLQKKSTQNNISICPNIQGKKILDFGCGYAHGLDIFLSSHIIEQLILYDKSEYCYENLKIKYEKNKKIKIIKNLDDLIIENLKLDVIIVHSVIQYIEINELKEILNKFNLILNDSGIIIFGDIPDKNTKLNDLIDLLKFSIKERIFIETIKNIIQFIFYKNYGNLIYYSEEILKNIIYKKFKLEKLDKNIGISRKRNSFILTKIIHK